LIDHCNLNIVVSLANLLESPEVILDEELGRSDGGCQEEDGKEERVKGFHNGNYGLSRTVVKGKNMRSNRS